ncbi:MAG: tetratricopeptide repeat protein [Candidatus Magnetominusculus sp. LBB02]|nr:tetratricopeptide repeat protein [Candidatus Magnetominusculus sp. LBB02]
MTGQHVQGRSLDFTHGLADIWIAAAIALATLFVFSEVRNFELLGYDDYVHITSNTHVNTGLNAENIRWAFTHSHDGNWYPMTLLSYMATVQLFGLSPCAHHLAALGLHVMNSLLLFMLFKRITGARWRAGFVAMVFAVHPMHVESVAWVSERKDVLSVFFGFLTMLSYVYYVRRASVMSYVAALILFMFSLMSKPMLVTLPFLLLLFDYWPLMRFSCGVKRLIAEKVPFILLSLTDAVITLSTQKAWGALSAIENLPLTLRLQNIPVSYVKYIMKMFYPGNMAFLYLYPKAIPGWQVGLSIAALIVISAFAIVMSRRLPYVLTGWFWYLAALVPVIGFVQAGLQSMADRYTYLPYVGLFVIAAMALPRPVSAVRRATAAALAVALIIILGVKAKAQVNYWHNSKTLYLHGLDVDDGNYVAHYNLGIIYLSEGNVNDAVTAFRKVILLKPTHVEAYINLGSALLFQLQRPEEAIAYFYKAIELNPASADGYNGVGAALATMKRPAQAVAYFEKAAALDPGFELARTNLKNARRDAGM